MPPFMVLTAFNGRSEMDIIIKFANYVKLVYNNVLTN